MFERYTERARRVIFFARYEASQFGSTTIETEHFLLGLIREDKNLTNRFLRSSSSIESIRKEIEGRTTIREKVSTSIDMPLSDECKRILAMANEEAERLNHRFIGTEHLLLAILREEKCVAAEILSSRGLRLDTIREELVRSEPDPNQKSTFLPLSSMGIGLFDSKALFGALETHGFISAKEHLLSALAASNLHGDWKTAQAELQLFLESLVDATSERLKGENLAFPIFEGFDWRLSLRSLRSGLSADDDWKFRWWLTLLLAEVLLKRFEQRLNS
jgi:Clp amino terminal domain, pathogenicity island component